VPEPSIEDNGGIRWLTLNRPDELNALTRDDLRVLRDAVQTVPAGIGALVLSGAGARAFSAGVHIDIFPGLTAHAARAFITELGTVMQAIRSAPVPSVCAIQGYCLGGAMELAMACDLRVAATDAVFGMPEIKVGVPSVLDAALLQQYVGLSKAKEMLLTGDHYPVAELEGTGFLNQTVAPDALRAAARGLAERVGCHARPAIAAQKRLFETWQEVGHRAAVAASVGEFAEVFAQPDTLERVAAYRQARGR
jgi:enoyl-CoA hydratase/carnithine racemase